MKKTICVCDICSEEFCEDDLEEGLGVKLFGPFDGYSTNDDLNEITEICDVCISKVISLIAKLRKTKGKKK